MKYQPTINLQRNGSIASMYSMSDSGHPLKINEDNVKDFTLTLFSSSMILEDAYNMAL